ncbi:MAG: hypothetical protein FJ027_13080 [Candidatus Rokubacteria bacterium]|nr:hypothetical protein [Candidatus Rokubacteria bacterium]
MENTISFRAVIFKSGDAWIGQCLEHDIAAQATTAKELTYQLERAVVGHIVIAHENGMTPFENVKPAPSRYWKMFEQGLKVEAPTDHRFVVSGHPSPPIPEIRLSDPVAEHV